MGRLNHHAVDNGDVEVHPLKFPFDFNFGSVTDKYTTLIKSVDDDEMDHFLELFHPEHDDDILNIDIKMLQY